MTAPMREVRALSDLKQALEDHSIDKPSFVYTTFIHATPERLWQALTDPAFTERYWGVAPESDWSTGSAITLHQWGVTIADPEQVILESEPYRRLSYTWHTFTPEWRQVVQERVGFSDEFLDRVAAERRSRSRSKNSASWCLPRKLSAAVQAQSPGGSREHYQDPREQGRNCDHSNG